MKGHGLLLVVGLLLGFAASLSSGCTQSVDDCDCTGTPYIEYGDAYVVAQSSRGSFKPLLRASISHDSWARLEISYGDTIVRFIEREPNYGLGGFSQGGASSSEAGGTNQGGASSAIGGSSP